ncbi:hypothetical protein C8R44DRAFT_139121 [Mycena epipterygia]|nr:hypothetical protein C8R44DRAFT_139121 [Mycena epipterygia]
MLSHRAPPPSPVMGYSRPLMNNHRPHYPLPPASVSPAARLCSQVLYSSGQTPLAHEFPPGQNSTRSCLLCYAPSLAAFPPAATRSRCPGAVFPLKTSRYRQRDL